MDTELEESTEKVDPGEKYSHAAPVWTRTRDLSITTMNPAL